ncbi:putative DNA modification/repair radical SAM protein [Gracilinema caldarium]|uniref:Radical SAM domain protein n=1 Tax=Gracilinema caldarium (strain ATCC 51460 / DSM 7334 / H1) TaxID=744872 RepID=F8F380_GRAC1|nr:putative DNA modification/repair radical SAM protein [Gracilinema caldarium]AEJ20406.1 Radical SAM domain protein [Gracilinema caldarium DSM 7334]
MELAEKLRLLAAGAKYDASCATSGSDHGSWTDAGTGEKSLKARSGPIPVIGATAPAGVCHSWTEDGRCVSLLKVLYSNVCRFDCAYCVNRSSADIQRTSFTVDELVKLTIEFYKRNYIEGLFLSSGIFSDSDVVMEKLIEVARRLRTEAGFGGYIHLKIIPGTGPRQLAEAGRWADRLSANIELPTEKSLQYLAPQKSGKLIMGAMEEVAILEQERTAAPKGCSDSGSFGSGGGGKFTFAPAGQSTQLIVGATPENDHQILNLSSALYRRFGLRRVYYSAFIPVGTPGRGGMADPRLPNIPGPPLVREHRLYQADWLLRFYKFRSDEILSPQSPFLDPHLDPKTAWALQHRELFPIDVQQADYEMLLRVPGIGVKSARRILEQRRSKMLTAELLQRLGVTMKRARYFISLPGLTGETEKDTAYIRRILSDADGAGLQLPLFEF